MTDALATADPEPGEMVQRYLDGEQTQLAQGKERRKHAKGGSNCKTQDKQQCPAQALQSVDTHSNMQTGTRIVS